MKKPRKLWVFNAYKLLQAFQKNHFPDFSFKIVQGNAKICKKALLNNI